MRKFFFLFIFLNFALFAHAENIPQPQGWVNDFANVIPAGFREKLTLLIQEVEGKTSSEIAVVTVASIAPYGEIEYARLLFDNWKPGKKAKDNGVLVLLAVKERRWRIETGYGVEGILPDGLCGEIGRNYMVPYFKAAKFGEGLYYGVTAIAKVIAKDANVSLETAGAIEESASGSTSSSNSIFSVLFILLMFGFITLINSLSFRRRKRNGYYGGWGYGGGYWGGGGFGGFGGGGGGGGGAGGGF